MRGFIAWASLTGCDSRVECDDDECDDCDRTGRELATRNAGRTVIIIHLLNSRASFVRDLKIRAYNPGSVRAIIW